MNKITKNKYLGSYAILNYRITKGQIRKVFKSTDAIKLRNALNDLYKKLDIIVVYADTDNLIVGENNG